MISLSHWGCFFIEYRRGYHRWGKATSDWYYNACIEWENEDVLYY